MLLTAAQQERYARHLLLDGLSGEGQERLLEGVALVRLPAEAAQAARWAVRYLAASGVGTLLLEGPWAEGAAAECRAQWPHVRIEITAGGGAGDSSPDGARTAAATTVEAAARIVAAGEREGDVVVRGGEATPSDAAALGAQAALEAMKRIARAGRPAGAPLKGVTEA